MFSSLRQPKRSASPKPMETPRVIPSIRLTAATPVTTNSTPLAPKSDGTTPRRVVPKRAIVSREAPLVPFPLPRLVIPINEGDGPQRPPSRSASHFGSSKLKVFLDSSSHGETPKLVKKKKSRVALDSIKWALRDRTNSSRQKDDKDTKYRSSIDSEKEREKRKWTIGRGKESKNKEKQSGASE